ncbi:hypothetical protein FISHEDRAFT_74463 [Fistulina hepatica ATCC 64428]|uniref:WD40 repeat-like protein n=1 Tax=Fistulina hepatica ATCC 64428 TaxID=1128425 RepID=A0A0D7ACK1_9AGAR|nr:hypothetical protein FISHEDRAFT_74463 [Fistulina hepatica ATCC 64428]
MSLAPTTKIHMPPDATAAVQTFVVNDAPVAGTSTGDDAVRSSSPHGAEQPQPDLFTNSCSGRVAVWHDPADADVSLDRLSSGTRRRLRKLPDHSTENIADLSGRESQAWVKNAQAAPRDELDGILSTTGHVPFVTYGYPDRARTRAFAHGSERRGTLSCWDLSSGMLVWKDVALPKSYASLDVGIKRKRVLAFSSGGYSVHLVDWDGGGTTGDAAGYLATIRAGSDGVAGIGWTGEHTLTVLSPSSTISLYDVRNINSQTHSTRCAVKWIPFDEGGGSARVLSTRGGRVDDGAWMSVGSASGLTNVYALPGLSASLSSSPLLMKTGQSLCTPILLPKSNHDARILALASQDAPAKSVGLRLFRAPMLTTFPNFPTSATPLGRVTALDFGRGSAEGDEGMSTEFLAIDERELTRLVELPPALPFPPS